MHKISIISRGQALGYIDLAGRGQVLTTKSALMDQMAMTLGGRAAEELVFHEVTTGAANDIEKVTATSKHMVMRYGMSEKLGPRLLGRNHDMPFLGREMGLRARLPEEIAREIDDEIRRVIEEAHDRACRVLSEHMEELHNLSELLIERDDRQGSVRALPRRRVARERLPEGEQVPAAEDEAEKPRAEPKPRPFPLPGATMQPPPEPEGAK